MSSPGWYPDPADPSVSSFWDGTAWTARRRWDGSAWVDAPVPSPSPRRRRAVLIGGGLAVVAVAALSGGSDGSGSGGSTVDAATFCQHLDRDLLTVNSGVLFESQLTSEQTAAARAGATAARRLAAESPDADVRAALEALARTESATAAGRSDDNPADDPSVQSARVTLWQGEHC